MQQFLFILLYYLFENIKTAKIYQCARYLGMQNQCLNQWVDTFGNVKVDLWKCPVNMYCHLLSKKYDENNFIGVCTYNYKKLYDKDGCSMDSQCSSFNCTNGKCIGFNGDEYCRPNYFQCANNLTCKITKEILPYGETKQVYKCAKLSQINETCENNNECDVKLVCGNYNIYNLIHLMDSYGIKNINEINNKISLEQYISAKYNTSKVCFERAKLDNGFPSSDSMICKSGDIIDIEIYPNFTESICASKKEIINDCAENNTCTIKANIGQSDIEIEQNCTFSAMGNPICPLEQKELAWKEYLEKFENYFNSKEMRMKNNEEKHFPVHKDTLNEYQVSQFFWRYNLWEYNIEADSCTKDYFFLINKDAILKISYFIIFSLILLF